MSAVKVKREEVARAVQLRELAARHAGSFVTVTARPYRSSSRVNTYAGELVGYGPVESGTTRDALVLAPAMAGEDAGARGRLLVLPAATLHSIELGIGYGVKA